MALPNGTVACMIVKDFKANMEQSQA